MKRKEYLLAAIECVCNDRQDQYGDPEDSFAMIGDLWEMYISHTQQIDIQLSPKDVAVLMALMKVARIGIGQHKDDSYIDACGYLAIAGALASAPHDRLVAIRDELMGKAA